MTDPSTVQQNINTYWDERSASYDATVGHGLRDVSEKEAWLTDLASLLPDPPSTLLDVGCGTGFVSLLAAELGHVVTGVDLSEGMLELARKKSAGLASPPAFVLGDAVEPPGAPGSFDTIISRHVIWTLRDPGAAFANWYQLLRSGGRVVAIDSFWFEEGVNPDGSSAQSDIPATAWEKYYAKDVRDALPIMHEASVEPIVHLLAQSGFERIDVRHLPQVEAFEAAEHSQDRYAIIAYRP